MAHCLADACAQLNDMSEDPSVTETDFAMRRWTHRSSAPVRISIARDIDGDGLTRDVNFSANVGGFPGVALPDAARPASAPVRPPGAR